MNEKKKKVPQLRFPGFSGEWEERKLGDVLDEMKSGLSRMLSNDDIGLPVVRANNVNDGTLNLVDDVKYWYIDDPQGANTSNYLVHKNDILVNFINSEAKMGTATIVDEEPDRDTIYTTNIMKLKVNSQNDPYFVFNQTFCQKYKNYVKSITKPAVNQASFTTVDFKKFDFSVPVKEEQQKIGAFFKQLDNLITLHQRKLSHLQTRKKGLLQKMFPKDGELFPELRFPGFTDAWEVRNMNDLVSQVVREVPKPIKAYKRISVRSHAKGTFHQNVDDPSTVAMDKLYVVKVNDLIVNITFAWEHAIAIAKPEDDGLFVSHRFPTYRADGKSDIQFVRYMVSRENFRRKLEFISPGGAGRNRVLNKSDFLKIRVVVPTTLKEQENIGNYFNKLDSQITLHQRKLNHLQTRKKALLQQLFV